MKDHQYGFPIKSLIYHSSGNVISSDAKICKMWNKNSGKVFTNIEATNDINDVSVFPNTGLVMFANEGVQMQSYYIPALGPAPKWCPFLENITEEFEETPDTTIYDDYKFVTKKELSNLSLSHLIGTNVLKAYMHGYFVDYRLYEKARAIANPFEFEDYKKQLIQKKIEDKKASRISAIKKLPKVNKKMAQKLMVDDQEDSLAQKKKKHLGVNFSKATDDNPLGDDRFAAMFQDEDFQVEEESHEYKLHHPSESQRKFEPIEDENDSDESDDNALRNLRHKKPKMYQVENQDIEKQFADRIKVIHYF